LWGEVMQVKQVSVFIENISGRLAEVSRVLGQNNVNIRALSIADTSEFGILRLIVNDPDLAASLLKKDGFSVGTTEVIAICVDDSPGGLTDALTCLEHNEIGIEYMYAFIGSSDPEKALVILRVEDTEKAIEVLNNCGIDTVPPNKIYTM
jgi:hypothetical protein